MPQLDCQRIFSRQLESLASASEVREVGALRDDRSGDGRMRREKFGLWLSLVERCVRDAEAVGSNPTSPIIFVRSGGTLKLLSHFS